MKPPKAGEAQDDMEEIDDGEGGSEWKLTKFDPHKRNTWRAGVRSDCVQLASYLNGGLLVWMIPMQMMKMMMMMIFCLI